jgi:hypothetical protein
MYGIEAVAKVYAGEFIQQMFAPWGVITEALPDIASPATNLLLWLLYLAFLVLALSRGIYRVARVGDSSIIVVMWLMFLYWLLTGAVSSYVGSRLRFPGDLLLIPLVGNAIAGLIPARTRNNVDDPP